MTLQKRIDYVKCGFAHIWTGIVLILTLGSKQPTNVVRCYVKMLKTNYNTKENKL